MDEKIFGLMAQAEELQDQTVRLFRECEKAREQVVEQQYQVRREILKISLLGSLILICISALLMVGLYYYIGSKQAKIARLEATIEKLEAGVRDWEKRAGKAELSYCGDQKRLCVRVYKDGTSYSAKGADESFRILYGY